MDLGYFMIYRVMLTFIPILVLLIIAARLIQSIFQWNKNNHAPKLTVSAAVVTKRADHYRRKSAHRTHYYATFQFDSSDRMELQMQGCEYGQLVEGDKGDLTFQGSRYLGFVRT